MTTNQPETLFAPVPREGPGLAEAMLRLHPDRALLHCGECEIEWEADGTFHVPRWLRGEPDAEQFFRAFDPVCPSCGEEDWYEWMAEVGLSGRTEN